MPDNSITPKLLKGAFIVFYNQSTLPKKIAFQINPESIKRQIFPSQSKLKFLKSGTARERISLILSVDNNLGDEFFEQNEDFVSYGVLPFISAIELMVSPTNRKDERSFNSKSNGIFRKTNLVGNILRLNQKKAMPYVGLLFGEKRIIPVKIKSIQIIENAFNKMLYPVGASVKIEMETLTERESKRHPSAIEMYRNYQYLKKMLSNRIE